MTNDSADDHTGRRRFGIGTVLVVALVSGALATGIAVSLRGGSDEGRTGGGANGDDPSLVVSPGGDVEHGAELSVEGSGFPANQVVGFAFCSSQVLDESDLGFCDMATLSNARTDSNGVFAATIVAKAVLSTMNVGEVECTTAAAGCVLGAAPVMDYSLIVDVGYVVDPASVPERPILDVELGQTSPIMATVSGRGYTPDSDVRVSICVALPDGHPNLFRCDDEQSQVVSASAEGDIQASILVRAFGQGAEVVDCATQSEACVVTTAAAPTRDLPTSVPLLGRPPG